MTKLLIVSDPHLLATRESTFHGWNTYCCFQKVLNKAMNNDNDWEGILLTGDISQHGEKSAYEIVKEELNQYRLPVYALPGNHDAPENVYQTFGQQKLFQLANNWSLVALNSYAKGQIAGMLSPEELQFLHTSLKENKDRYLLIALHHPPVAIGTDWIDDLRLLNQNDFWNVVKQHNNVRGVLFGHAHCDYETIVETIPCWCTPAPWVQFALGNNCSSKYDDQPGGYRSMILGEDGLIHTEVFRL